MSGFAQVVGQPDGPPTLPPFMLADGVAAQARIGWSRSRPSLFFHRDRSRAGLRQERGAIVAAPALRDRRRFLVWK
jgi:hypothetical protein